MSDETPDKPEKTGPVKDLATKSKDAATQAREQAHEYGATIFDSTRLRLDDGTVVEIPPHPTLRELDEDVLEALDQLDIDMESCDRYPDNADGTPGAVMIPYRRGGVRVSPPWDVQRILIALGEDAYAQLRAGTVNGKRGSVKMVKEVWRAQGEEITRRQAKDSKSAGSSVDLAPVPEADS